MALEDVHSEDKTGVRIHKLNRCASTLQESTVLRQPHTSSCKEALRGPGEFSLAFMLATHLGYDGMPLSWQLESRTSR